MKKQADLNNRDWSNGITRLLGNPKKSAKEGTNELDGTKKRVSSSSSQVPHSSRPKVSQGIAKFTQGTAKIVQDAALNGGKFIKNVAASVGNLYSETKDKFSDSANTIVEPAEPDWDALILEELDHKSNFFASMLNLTTDFIASEQHDPESAEQLVKKWEYAFTIGECAGLAHKFKELRHDKNEDADELLKDMMDLFDQLGLKKLDVQNPMVVSPENRFYFDNGIQFPDGTLCDIIRWPWVYKEKAYFQGMLSETER